MLKRWVIVIAMIMAVVGCAKLQKVKAFTPDRDTAYLKEEQQPPLKMPEGIRMGEGDYVPFYPLVEGPLPPVGSTPADIKPPTLTNTQVSS